MSKVAVVFWSATGNTETMANCVAEGANGTIVPCSEMNAAKLAEFDAVAFGCPAMGAEQLEEWILPSLVLALAAKISRMTMVRSITFVSSISSRFLSCAGESSSSQITPVAPVS